MIRYMSWYITWAIAIILIEKISYEMIKNKTVWRPYGRSKINNYISWQTIFHRITRSFMSWFIFPACDHNIWTMAFDNQFGLDFTPCPVFLGLINLSSYLGWIICFMLFSYSAGKSLDISLVHGLVQKGLISRVGYIQQVKILILMVNFKRIHVFHYQMLILLVHIKPLGYVTHISSLILNL
jgi:hypothetical protein